MNLDFNRNIINMSITNRRQLMVNKHVYHRIASSDHQQQQTIVVVVVVILAMKKTLDL